jgi:hypothetical protein
VLQIAILIIRGYLVSWVTMTALLGTIAISARANAEGLYRTVHTSIREHPEAITSTPTSPP